MSVMEGSDGSPFVLPVCWKDDVRMRALFAEFRPKELNPEGWQDKMDFWVSLILQWSRETRTPVFSASDVAIAFERKRSQPACLRTVLSHMKKSGGTCKHQGLLHQRRLGQVGLRHSGQAATNVDVDLGFEQW
ncbi:hypothetical protein MRX96_042934 [Rhipicephalus microplus]